MASKFFTNPGCLRQWVLGHKQQWITQSKFDKLSQQSTCWHMTNMLVIVDVYFWLVAAVCHRYWYFLYFDCKHKERHPWLLKSLTTTRLPNCSLSLSKQYKQNRSYSSLRKSKAFDLSLGSWDKVLLLFLTDGVMWEVGALYLTFTGGSGFLAVVPEELNSLLKLGGGGEQKQAYP